MGKSISFSLFYSRKWFYPISMLSTLVKIIKEFHTLIFNFLWKGKGKVIRLSTYAPCEFGDFKMKWLWKYDFQIFLFPELAKKISEKNCNGPFKSCFKYLLKHQGGKFLLEWSIAPIKSIFHHSQFYQELLIWWLKNRRWLLTQTTAVNILLGIIRKFWLLVKVLLSVFCIKKYFVKGIKYTNDLLFNINNLESFNIMKQKGIVNSHLLIWTSLRKYVPQHLRENNS